jgi:hypothetical protein
LILPASAIAAVKAPRRRHRNGIHYLLTGTA